MTLDEAIKHAEEVAEEKESEAEDLEYSRLDWRHEANQCLECAKEHRQLAEWLKDYKRLLEQEPCEDTIAIHTQGLDEGIRCAMCTNSMKSNRGCDGGCAVNEGMYREVMNTIRNHIVPPVTPTRKVEPSCGAEIEGIKNRMSTMVTSVPYLK